MERLNKLRCLNATHLKIFAMICMVLDHAWGTLVTGHLWMTCVGRIAFPIFAFQIAEGYAHTKNFKKYLLRMFLFALVSEIPFNFMIAGSWFYPFYQNVMFTFCIALVIIRLADKARGVHWTLGTLAVLVGGYVGYLLGSMTFVDYNGSGVLMVLVFWLFRNVPFGGLVQLIALYYINCELLGGRTFDVLLFGSPITVPVQGFALLAFVLIFLYNGEKRKGGKALQYIGYGFYPVHMLALYLIRVLI